MPVEKSCQLCDKKYFVRPCHANSTKYCSRRCSGVVNGKIREEKNNSKEYLLSKIKVDKKTGCWIWQGCKNKDGYGEKSYKGKRTRVHRVFYELFIGKIPKGMCVCHKCDIPACVNPSHLFIGTHQDNSDDKMKKKRNKNPIGEKHGMAKLKEKDVLEIRRLYKEGYSSRKIGRKFNAGKSTILRIVRRNNWNHI